MKVPYGMQLLLKRILKREYSPAQWKRVHAHRHSRAIQA